MRYIDRDRNRVEREQETEKDIIAKHSIIREEQKSA